MTTTSTNFALIIATTSDTVNVVVQIANNFTTLDALLSIAHTGTGQLKNSLTLTTPILNSPTISGTASGGTISSTTGRFQTLTATGGMLTADSFAIGTYAFPATVGATNQILQVQTGNLVFANNSPGTGAGESLDNLANVAINTSLNTFIASHVTVTTLLANTITGTGGTLSGMTSVSATTGTYTNITVAGTVAAQVVNMTGGSITAGSFAIGTYSYPATVGSSNQVLKVTTGNATWGATPLNTAFFWAYTTGTVDINSAEGIFFGGEVFDSANIFNGSALTITASGYYYITCRLVARDVITQGSVTLGLMKTGSSAHHVVLTRKSFHGGVPPDLTGSALFQASSGDVFILSGTESGTSYTVQGNSPSLSYFMGYKIPDS